MDDIIHLDHHNVLTDMFPDIDPAFFEQRLQQAQGVPVIIEEVLNNRDAIPKKPVENAQETPGQAPRVKTRVKPVKQDRRRTIDYFSIVADRQYDIRYQNLAVELLVNQFLTLRNDSIRTVLRTMNWQYAPTLKVLLEKIPSDLKLGGRPIHIEVGANNRKCRIQPLGNLRKYMAPQPDLWPKNFRHEVRWACKKLREDLKIQIELEPALERLTLENDKSLLDSTVAAGEGWGSSDNNDEHSWVQCPICFDDCHMDDSCPCSEGHVFCCECVAGHAQQSVYGQGKAEIACMDLECTASFSRAALESVMDKKTLKRFDERLLEENLARANLENFIRCKFCNYGQIVDVPVSVNKVFKCENEKCGKQVCRLCKVDWQVHFGKSCRELEEDAETKFRREAEEKLTDSIIRKCHRCQAPILKEQGCNKMTCRCGATLCYLCRKPDITYDHFCRHPLSPGKKCFNCPNPCMLFENAEKRDEEQLGRIRQEISDQQQAFGKNIKIHGVDENLSQNQQNNYNAAVAGQ